MSERTASVLMAALQAPLSGYRRRFRLLSADTVLHAVDANGRPFSFSIPSAVLQAAVALWDGALVKVQHSRDPLKAIGQIERAAWSEATPECPGGIDGDVVLTQKTDDGRTASALLEQGLIRCASSNIAFESGEPGADGVLPVTRIVHVREASLVDEGADPHSAALAAAGAKNMDLMSMILAALVRSGKIKEGEKPSDEELAVILLPLLAEPDGDEAEPPKEPKPEEPPAEGAAAKDMSPEELKEQALAKVELSRLLAAVGAETVDAACAKVLDLQLRSVDAPPVVDVIGDGIALGKIAPAEVATFRAMLAHSREAVVGLLAKRKIGEKVPVSSRQSSHAATDAALSASGETAALTLTAEEKAMCKANHMDEAKYLAAKQRRTVD